MARAGRGGQDDATRAARARRTAQRRLARDRAAGRSPIAAQGRAYRAAVKLGKPMWVMAQVSPNEVRKIRVSGLTKAERSRVARHWNQVHHYLKDYNEQSERKLYQYEGRNIGGDSEYEFANDPELLKTLSVTDPDEFDFESIYVEE